jgi:uncharacterized protein YlzI (FlbEa/FlbD family)
MRLNLTYTLLKNYKFKIMESSQEVLFNKVKIFSKKIATVKLIIAVV